MVRVAISSYGCNEDLNDLCLRFKTATKALLKDLGMSLKGFQYSFGDLYEMFTQIFSDPQKYGEYASRRKLSLSPFIFSCKQLT